MGRRNLLFAQLLKILELKIKILDEELCMLNDTHTKLTLKQTLKQKWDLETGEKFNDLINSYPISEEELLDISECVCKFVSATRITDIRPYLFKDKDMENPIVKYRF